MNNKCKGIIAFLSFFVLITISTNTITGENIKHTQEIEPQTYTGYLRIYIVEPLSRYNGYDDRPYHNGFLDFAYEGLLSIEYNETYENSITWKGPVTKDNVFVIAAIFNPIAQVGYAYPPSSKPFEAHYVDAAAAAYPDQTGNNTRNETITHTVFIEEGSATWCKSCPSMADVLHNISKDEKYDFYYTAMVEDLNEVANDRVRNEMNIYGFPTIYVDGGKEVLMGGNYEEAIVESLIETCAESNVHDLDLNLSVEWLGDGELKIDYNITNLEEINYQTFDIKKIWGGIRKIYAIVENTGDTDVTDVEWQIMIKGGLINRIDTTMSGTIKDFPMGCKKIIKAKARLFQIYGFGKIDVAVQVGTSVKTTSGLIFGRFVIVL